MLQAHYFTDDEIFIQEVALYKLATPKVLENPDISKAVRQHGAQIVEVNPTYTVVSKKRMTDDIMSLYFALNEYKCVLQYALILVQSEIKRHDVICHSLFADHGISRVHLHNLRSVLTYGL